VIGSCGKKKLSTSQQAPDCTDLLSKRSLKEWSVKLPKLLYPAREMYSGYQTRELVKGVDLLREIKGVEIDFFILSAGFGLIKEKKRIPPYDCSFVGMRKNEIKARSEALSIPRDFNKIIKKPYDLAYLALGQKYLFALGEEWLDYKNCTIIAFGPQVLGERILKLPANKETVMAFSKAGYKIHGIAGFKGDLFRILALYAQHKKAPYKEVMNWKNDHNLVQLVYELGSLGEPSNIAQTSIITGSS
jgi:hypothetical protein